MFQGEPEQRLWLAKQRQAQLIHEAEQYRLATANRDDRDDNLSTPPFNIRASLAQMRALVWRAIFTGEAPCDDPCPGCAPG